MPDRHETLVAHAPCALRTSIACDGLNATQPHHRHTQRRTCNGDLFSHPQSFLFPFWQNVIDFNASLISIPLGTVSGTLSGFAFENVDGTYTIFLGTDIVVGENAPISGTATEIVRRMNSRPVRRPLRQASLARSRLPASMRRFGAAGRSLRASSPAATLVEIDSPASIGPLAQSPLIKTQATTTCAEASTPIPSTRAGATIMVRRRPRERHDLWRRRDRHPRRRSRQ